MHTTLPVPAEAPQLHSPPPTATSLKLVGRSQWGNLCSIWLN